MNTAAKTFYHGIGIDKKGHTGTLYILDKIFYIEDIKDKKRYQIFDNKVEEIKIGGK